LFFAIVLLTSSSNSGVLSWLPTLLLDTSTNNTSVSIAKLPANVRVPATTVLPVEAATVNLSVFTATLPEISTVPAIPVLPVDDATVNLSVFTF
jgi:hypothetical protein